MFGQNRDSERGGAGGQDERLSVLLRKWSAVEPCVGFEDAVWREIRAVPETHPTGLWERWVDWSLPHPIWAAAAAAAVALVIGFLAGLTTPVRAWAGGHDTHPLLHPRTLMGTYAALSERGH